MKNITLYILLLFNAITSCKSISSEIDIDSKNKTPPFLVDISIYREMDLMGMLRAPDSTFYTYSNKGILLRYENKNEIVTYNVFNKNLNNSNLPYVIKTTNFKGVSASNIEEIFTDKEQKVTKIIFNKNLIHAYSYDSLNRVKTILVNSIINKSPKDTIFYNYPNEKEYSITKNVYETPNIKKQQIITYFLTDILNQSSWISYPYNFGDMSRLHVTKETTVEDSKLIKTKKNLYELNDKGLISKVSNQYLSYYNQTEFIYKAFSK